MLKSDLGGIETLYLALFAVALGMLKSDLGGIETSMRKTYADPY